MNLQEAMVLVRAKFLEERQDIIEGNTRTHYDKACKDYPATMQIAHIYFAQDIRDT